MANLADLVANLRLNASGFTAGLDRSMGKLRGASDKMKSVGTSMSIGLTAPLTIFAGLSVRTFANFESGMNRVRGITGAAGADFEALRDQAAELGRTTQFTATQAAEAMNFLAMAGFETNEVLGAMPGTLQLAAAASLDLGSAADIATNVLTGFGLEVEDLGMANDVLAKAMTSANTNLSQLGQAFKFAGPVAKGAGLSFTDTAAALALMGNAGIQASMAGTSLRGAITRTINPTKQVGEAMDALGISVKDTATGNMLPMTDILKQLEEAERKTGGGAAFAGEMMKIFGQRAGPAMVALVGQGSDALAQLKADLDDAGGTAQHLADVNMQGLRGAMLRMKSAVEGAAIAIGETLAPVVSAIGGVVATLAQKFAELSPWLKTVIVGVGALAAAIGPLLLIVGTLAGPLSTAIGLLGGAGLTGIIATLSPFLGPLAIAVGAVAAAWGLWQLEPVQEAVRKLWGAIKDAASSLADALKPAIDAVWPILQGLGEVIGVLVEGSFKVLFWIIGEVAGILIGTFADGVKAAAWVFENVLGPALDFAIGGLERLLEWIMKIPGVSQLVDAAGNTFDALKESIRGTGEEAETSFATLKTAVTEAKENLAVMRDEFMAGKATAEEYATAQKAVTDAQAALNEQTKSGAPLIALYRDVLAEAKEEMSAAKKHMAELEEELEKGKDVTQELAGAQNCLVKAQQEVDKAQGKLTSAVTKYGKEVPKVEKSSKKLKDTLGSLAKGVGDLDKKTKRVTKSFDAFWKWFGKTSLAAGTLAEKIRRLSEKKADLRDEIIDLRLAAEDWDARQESLITGAEKLADRVRGVSLEATNLSKVALPPLVSGTAAVTDGMVKLSDQTILTSQTIGFELEKAAEAIRGTGVEDTKEMKVYRNLEAMIEKAREAGIEIPAEQQVLLDKLKAEAEATLPTKLEGPWKGAFKNISDSLTQHMGNIKDILTGEREGSLLGELKHLGKKVLEVFIDPFMDALNNLIELGIKKLIGWLTGEGGLLSNLGVIGGALGGIFGGWGGGARPPAGGPGGGGGGGAGPGGGAAGGLAAGGALLPELGIAAAGLGLAYIFSQIPTLFGPAFGTKATGGTEVTTPEGGYPGLELPPNLRLFWVPTDKGLKWGTAQDYYNATGQWPAGYTPPSGGTPEAIIPEDEIRRLEEAAGPPTPGIPGLSAGREIFDRLTDIWDVLRNETNKILERIASGVVGVAVPTAVTDAIEDLEGTTGAGTALSRIVDERNRRRHGELIDETETGTGTGILRNIDERDRRSLQTLGDLVTQVGDVVSGTENISRVIEERFTPIEELPEAIGESISRIIDERERRAPQPISVTLEVDGQTLANAMVNYFEDSGKTI